MVEPRERRVAVTLNAPPTLEERIVDWVLESEGSPGFTSYAASGHGERHDALNIAEQVSGRQRRVEFRIELPDAALDGFLAALARSFDGTDLRYFVVPITRSGHLGRNGGADDGAAPPVAEGPAGTNV